MLILWWIHEESLLNWQRFPSLLSANELDNYGAYRIDLKEVIQNVFQNKLFKVQWISGRIALLIIGFLCVTNSEIFEIQNYKSAFATLGYSLISLKL